MLSSAPMPTATSSSAPSVLSQTSSVGEAPARLIFAASPSWKARLPSYAGMGALVLGGLAGAGGATFLYGPWGMAVATLTVLGLVALTVAELRRRATRYRVTSRTVDVERGVLARTIDTVQLWRVRDVEFRQSLSQRMFGVGTIRLVTRDATTPEVLLDGVADARSVFEALKRAVETATPQRNVLNVVE